MSSIVTITDKLDFFKSIFGDVHLTNDSKNFEIVCPFCTNVKAGKKKLSVKVSNSICHCWVCGWKSRSAYPLIKKFGTKNDMMLYKMLFKMNNKEYDTSDDNKSVIKLPEGFTHILECNKFDLNNRDIYRYLSYDRQISDKLMWKFAFGVSKDLPRRVVCPSFSSTGDVNFYTARSIDESTFRKYMNCDGERNDIVFNELNIDWTREITLVEGIFDAVKCPDNTIPMLGSELNEMSYLFNQILIRDARCIIYLDNDAQHKSHKIARLLDFYNIDVKIANISKESNKSDPGERTLESNIYNITNAKQINWIEYIKIDLEKNLMKNKRIF